MTEASNITLTEELLTEELVKWQAAFGNGRNDSDLRFGQFIWCKYNVGVLFPDPHASVDGFGTEDPLTAFNQIHSKL